MMAAAAELIARKRARVAVPASALQHALGHIAQRLAAERIDRLDRQRIKRPEIDLRHPQQRPPSDPSQGDDGQKDKNRAESGYLRGGA